MVVDEAVSCCGKACILYVHISVCIKR